MTHLRQAVRCSLKISSFRASGLRDVVDFFCGFTKTLGASGPNTLTRFLFLALGCYHLTCKNFLPPGFRDSVSMNRRPQHRFVEHNLLQHIEQLHFQSR